VSGAGGFQRIRGIRPAAVPRDFLVRPADFTEAPRP
jgi:hypothetical protein